MDEFCYASGQRVNYGRSLLYVSPNIDGQTAADLGRRLGIPLTGELGRYLGHHLIHKGRGDGEHGGILDKVRGKLEGWKSRCLSWAGRLTLAMAVINNIGVFYMQAQRLSTKTHKEIDRAVRQCIWGSSALKKKIHLLNWETLCRQKEWGGAGIRRAANMNKSLLAKLGWPLLTCGEDTWCQVMREKYGLRQGMPLSFKHKQHESQIWKGVVWASDLLCEGLRWKARNGRSVSFWSDRWVGDVKLMDQSLRNIEREELESTVNCFWQEQQGWKWELLSSSLPDLMHLRLDEMRINPLDTMHDEFGWLDPWNKSFTVKSVYLLLRRDRDYDNWEGWKKIWKLRTQERIKVFMWLTAHDKILTNYSRRRQRLALVRSCDRCEAMEEDALHALHDCGDSKEVWNCFVPLVLQGRFFSSQSLKEWLLLNLKLKRTELQEERWPESMELICWRLWK